MVPMLSSSRIPWTFDLQQDAGLALERKGWNDFFCIPVYQPPVHAAGLNQLAHFTFTSSFR